MNGNSKFVLYCLLSELYSPSNPAHHEAARGQLRPRQGALQAPLAVLRQTSAARHPSEDPLHDPAAVENRDIFGFLDDFKIGPDAEIPERGRQLLSLVSAVRPELRDMRCRLQHSDDHGRCPSLRPYAPSVGSDI